MRCFSEIDSKERVLLSNGAKSVAVSSDTDGRMKVAGDMYSTGSVSAGGYSSTSGGSSGPVYVTLPQPSYEGETVTQEFSSLDGMLAYLGVSGSEWEDIISGRLRVWTKAKDQDGDTYRIYPEMSVNILDSDTSVFDIGLSSMASSTGYSWVIYHAKGGDTFVIDSM